MPRLVLVLVALAAAGCPPPRTLPTSGCGKDTDCKGARICVRGVCVDPQPAVSPPADAAADLAPGEIPDGGAPDLAVTLPPRGASAGFHVDARHAGRSPFFAPERAPEEIARIATAGVVYGSPAITDEGWVVFGAHDRTLYAATPDGVVKWRYKTGDLIWAAPALGGGGVVYVGSDDDNLYAFDLADGKLRWQFRAGPCRIATGSGPEAARCDVDGVTVGADGTVYFNADGLYALSPDGTLKWKFQAAPVHCAGAPALGADGTIYVGCRDDALYAVAPDGTKKWEYRTGGDVDAAPAVAPDGTIYAGADDGKLYALSPDGSLRFAVVTGGAVRSSPAIGADGTVYVGSFDGALYAVRRDGTVAWRFRTADRVLSSPLVDAAGLIVFGSQDDRLYALHPDGRLAWSLLLDGDVDGTPALGPDGTLWVGADDKALHGFRAREKNAPAAAR
jgi:outer membrane protein assembly factor BamB